MVGQPMQGRADVGIEAVKRGQQAHLDQADLGRDAPAQGAVQPGVGIDERSPADRTGDQPPALGLPVAPGDRGDVQPQGVGQIPVSRQPVAGLKPTGGDGLGNGLGQGQIGRFVRIQFSGKPDCHAYNNIIDCTQLQLYGLRNRSQEVIR